MEQQKTTSPNVVLGLVRGWAAMIYPFLRTNVGRKHPGIFGLIGMGWVLVWVAYTPGHRLTWLLPAFIAGQAMNCICKRKVEVHSNYGGDPVIARLIGFKNERVAKLIGEPLIALAFGMVLLMNGYDEGRFFAIGAVMLIVNQGMIDMYDQRRINDMRDGMIEGKYYMNRVK